LIKARLFVIGAAVCFATGGTVIKLSGLSGWQISCFRSAAAVLLLSLLMPKWRDWWKPPCLAVGLAFGATFVLFVIANTMTTAANTIFLQYSSVLYMLVLGPRWLGEPNRRSDFALIALLATGMLLLFAGQDPASLTAPDPATGNLLAAAAGVTWALTLMGLRWLATRDDLEDGSGAAVISGCAIACLASLPMAFPVETIAPTDWAVIAFLGAIQISLPYFLLTRGMQQLRALEASLLLLIEPLASSLLAWGVHGEVPSLASLAGCGLIFAGVVAEAARAAPDSREAGA